MQSIFHLVSEKVESWWGNLWLPMIQWRLRSQGKGARSGLKKPSAQIGGKHVQWMESPQSGRWMIELSSSPLWAWCMNWSASKLCLTWEVAHCWRQDPRPMAASGFSWHHHQHPPPPRWQVVDVLKGLLRGAWQATGGGTGPALYGPSDVPPIPLWLRSAPEGEVRVGAQSRQRRTSPRGHFFFFFQPTFHW